MEKLIITGEKLKVLKERYKDSLELQKKNDLTEWGRGEMNVLELLFKNLEILSKRKDLIIL